jgi:hypothetical protein
LVASNVVLVGPAASVVAVPVVGVVVEAGLDVDAVVDADAELAPPGGALRPPQAAVSRASVAPTTTS